MARGLARRASTIAILTTALGVAVPPAGAATREVLFRTMTVPATPNARVESDFTLPPTYSDGKTSRRYRMVVSGQVRHTVPDGVTFNPVTGQPNPGGYADYDALYCFGSSAGGACSPPREEPVLCFELRQGNSTSCTNRLHQFADPPRPLPPYNDANRYEASFRAPLTLFPAGCTPPCTGRDARLYVGTTLPGSPREDTYTGSFTIQLYTRGDRLPRGCKRPRKARAAARERKCTQRVPFRFKLAGFPLLVDPRYMPQDLVDVELTTVGTKLVGDGGNWRGRGAIVMETTYLGFDLRQTTRSVTFTFKPSTLTYFRDENTSRHILLEMRATSSLDPNCPKGARLQLSFAVGRRSAGLALGDLHRPGSSSRCLSYRDSGDVDAADTLPMGWNTEHFKSARIGRVEQVR